MLSPYIENTSVYTGEYYHTRELGMTSSKQHEHWYMRATKVHMGLGFSLNPEVTEPFIDTATEVFSHRSEIVIVSEVVMGWPHEGEAVNVHIGIMESEMQRPSVKNDYLVLDQDGEIQFERHRGCRMYKYDCPSSIGYKEKRPKHVGHWNFYVWMSPTPFKTAMILFNSYQQPYVSLTCRVDGTNTLVTNIDISNTEL